MRKLESPSSERNKQPIWNVLESKVFRPVLSQNRNTRFQVLEIAAGAGVHTQYFCLQLLSTSINFRWFCTDPSPSSLESQSAHRNEHSALIPLIHQPLPLTLGQEGIIESSTNRILNDTSFDLVICINMIHISPWTATIGLMQAACKKIRSGGTLFLYGPFRMGGVMVESNVRFDEYLQSQDPTYGVRNLEDVVQLARDFGFFLKETIEMPANNLCVLFSKQQ